MRAYPEFRLQLKHNNKWVSITCSWELSTLNDQINIYKKKGHTFRVQRLTNGRYK
jgi:hypothetical protein